MLNSFTTLDITIIFLYLIITLGIGFFYARQGNKNSKEYFLAGKNIGWFAVGISIFATNISSEHFIGLAGSGAQRGLAVAQFELMAVFILILLAWFLTPIYFKSGVTTLPEFLGKRFDQKIRKFFAVFSIIIYIFTKISVTLFAGGLIFYKLFGLNIYSSAIMIVLLTGLYTLIGGAKSVIKTSVFQGILLILGAVLLTVFGMIEVGGFSGLQSKLPHDYFNMFKHISDPEFPWTGIIFGAPILAFWYWCTDQYIVQKILSAKSMEDARLGTLFAAAIKITPVFILVLPGLIAAAIFPNIIGDNAYALLIASDVIPSGIKGLVLAGLLAAIMSSLSNIFSVAATLFTNDLYKPKRINASEDELVLVGRLSTLVMILLAILCVPLVKMIDNGLYIYLQVLQAYVSPPIAAVFVFGLFTKWATSKSVFWSLLIGEALGLSRLVMDMLVKWEITNNSILIYLSQINFLHQAIGLFFISSFIIIVISLREKAVTVDVSRYVISLKQDITYSFQEDIGSSNAIFHKSKINFIISGFLMIVIIGLWSLWY